MQLLVKFQSHSSSTSEVIGYCSEPHIPKFYQNRDFSTLTKYTFWSKQLWTMILNTQYPYMTVFQMIYWSFPKNFLWRQNFDGVIIRTCVVWAGILGDRNEFAHYNWYYSSLSNKISQVTMAWFESMNKIWHFYGKNALFCRILVMTSSKKCPRQTFFPNFGNYLLGTTYMCAKYKVLKLTLSRVRAGGNSPTRHSHSNIMPIWAQWN